MIDLSNLQAPKGSTKKRKRVGRGTGSGVGRTAGRGQKGQKSRSGGSIPIGFEGGQMPLARRIPKRGFTNIFRAKVAIVRVSDLNHFEANAVVDADALVAAGLLKGRYDLVKILADGEVEKALTVKVHRISASAREKIERAGGTVEVLGG
jgi:large subunit ribosomal protein L15